ncbi:MAG TPA: tyrosine-type recombinase/integrase [Pseudolabrys sp.]|nr:tyrosine-type recombinase/integrase [Pseudolabrys sp.]
MAVRKRVWMTRKGEQKEAWIADYTDGTGKRHIQTFAQKKMADAFAAKTKVDVNAGVHVNSDLTMAQVADRWLKRVAADGRERTTLRQYGEHVRLHIVPRIGGLKLKNFTVGHAEHFRDDLLSGDKKLSPAMARKVWVSFKSMLKNEHCGHLTGNAQIRVSKRNKRKLEVGRDIPTTDEVRRLIEVAANRPKQCMFLKVAALTGLRASELLGLRWSDIDLKTNELHVRQRVDRFREIGAPKSESGTRTIPFGADLALALKQWKLACPKGELNLVFPSRLGTVIGYRSFTERLGPIFKAAHVVDKAGKPKYAPHALRHFFASWCINPKDRGGRELPAKVVQQWLGHSSITMTLDIYGHLFRDKSDRAEITASEKALLG